MMRKLEEKERAIEENIEDTKKICEENDELKQKIEIPSSIVTGTPRGDNAELDKEAQAHMNEELSGWKLVAGDVFREPTNSTLLCVMVTDGVQITGMAVAALGFMSPASREFINSRKASEKEFGVLKGSQVMEMVRTWSRRRKLDICALFG